MQAYLSMVPEQRNTVKSQYHCATLLGNWEEERRGFGPQATAHTASDGTFLSTTLVPPPTSGGPSLPVDPSTTYTTSFKAHTVAEQEASKPPASLAGEAPRELLFYHGDLAQPTEKNLLTIQEMSYTNHTTAAPYTNDEILDLHGVSTRRDKVTTLRRSMGFAASSGSNAGSRKGGKDEDEKSSAAIEKESTLIRTLVQPVEGELTSDADAQEDGGYVPPRLPPVGRVATREGLLTTKNVTIDATGQHLYSNLEAYPLTSSVCVGKMMASKNDPMHKTHLRVQYELTK